MNHVTKRLWLLGSTVVICCLIYPLAVWAIGQTFFPFTANGSIVNGPDMFFENFSKEYPGKFPSAVTTQLPGGRSATAIEPVASGSDVESIFFDMWRQDHADAELANVPGDMVTTSGSGLDPHITLDNAEYQLDRVATKWATDTKRNPAEVRAEIDQILQTDLSHRWTDS